MKTRRWVSALLYLGGAATLGSPATRAQSASDSPAAGSTAQPPAIPGWAALIAELQDLPSRMLARLPTPLQSDPQIQQEVGRLALESLASSALDILGSDADHPVFMPTLSQVLNVGQPNADTIYRSALIAPGGSYRIRGKRGTLKITQIGESGPTPGDPGASSHAATGALTYHDVNTLHVDGQDRFDVILSPQRPAGYQGDWWQLHPGTQKLLLRMVSSDWGKEEDPTFSIERIDKPVERPRPSATYLESRLRDLPKRTDFMALLFVDHFQKLRDAGFVNKFKTFDISQAGGLTGQFYYEGDYDLADDEALIVEAKAPSQCRYRSLILTNELYETTDWTDNYSSLNDAQAKVDGDGILRIVVSARDPGVPNWLDTAGYPRGLIQGRWTDCNAQPIPTMRKVKLAEVRKYLPAATRIVTPPQREQMIRERRAEYQQRPLW